jgi:hypothetical protein
MHLVETALLAVAALANLVIATPCADSVGSDLQILLHNDLYGNESSHNDVVIVLGTSQTHDQAEKACAALSESLWTPSSNAGAADFLAYLTYRAGLQTLSRVMSRQLPATPNCQRCALKVLLCLISTIRIPVARGRRKSPAGTLSIPVGVTSSASVS